MVKKTQPLRTAACGSFLRLHTARASLLIVCYAAGLLVRWYSGGRFFQCATCHGWLCEDDQAEHQSKCTVLETESYKCGSCSRFGVWSCLKCKVCFCDTHYKGNVPTAKGEEPKCKKCATPLSVTKNLPISTKSYKYGRKKSGKLTADTGAGATDSKAADGDSKADGAGSDDDDDGGDDSARYNDERLQRSCRVVPIVCLSGY
jgi:hypothetical protein